MIHELPGSVLPRAALAFGTAFVAGLALGPALIRALRRRRIGEKATITDSARLNVLHASKQDTPTMGGIGIVGISAASGLAFARWDVPYTWVLVGGLVLFGAIGAIDDWVKLTRRQKGISARAKIRLQIVAAVALLVLLHPDTIHVPFAGLVSVGAVLAVLFGVIVVVGASNAVNLTDGLDGLAGGTFIASGTAVAAYAYAASRPDLAAVAGLPFVPGAGEAAVVLAGAVGATLAFLWWNCHPAEVFMGDTGSLPLGALLGLAAIVAREEFALCLAGGVFVAEALSVLGQVAWFKATGGRRLFLCAPLHHHFQFRGLPETKVVQRFWIAAALLAAASVVIPLVEGR